jgi:hypothetical protein
MEEKIEKDALGYKNLKNNLEELNIWKNIKFLTMEYHLEKNKYNTNRVAKALDKIGFKLLTKLDKSKKVSYGLVLAYNPIYISK